MGIFSRKIQQIEVKKDGMGHNLKVRVVQLNAKDIDGILCCVNEMIVGPLRYYIRSIIIRRQLNAEFEWTVFMTYIDHYRCHVPDSEKFTLKMVAVYAKTTKELEENINEALNHIEYFHNMDVFSLSKVDKYEQKGLHIDGSLCALITYKVKV